MKRQVYARTGIGRLTCDGCGYREPDGRKLTESMIGTKCLKCGADMLTRADYEAAVAFEKSGGTIEVDMEEGALALSVTVRASGGIEVEVAVPTDVDKPTAH